MKRCSRRSVRHQLSRLAGAPTGLATVCPGARAPQLSWGVRRTRPTKWLLLEWEGSDAEGEPRWMEDLRTRPQVPGVGLLSEVTAGARAAVGCAEDATAHSIEAPGGVTPRPRRRLTSRRR